MPGTSARRPYRLVSRSRELAEKPLAALRALLTRTVRLEIDRIPLELRDVPLRKILNWAAVGAAGKLRLDRTWFWPPYLQVEPSTRCNLRCPVCAVTVGLERPIGLMSMATFRKAIDELCDHLLLILLWDWGEPFLNPHVYDMIAYARSRRIHVVSSTNGHLFATGDHAERLVRSGLDAIIFAVDGVTQESYERYRVGGKLATVLSGIERVVAAKRRLGSSSPLVNLRLVVMRHNEHEVPELPALARALGVDMYSLKTVSPGYLGRGGRPGPDAVAIQPRDVGLRRWRVSARDGLPVRRKRNPCTAPWSCPSLHWDGKLSPCTFDASESQVLGDLWRQSLREIWWGVKARELRQQLRGDYHQIALCADCTSVFEGGLCGRETIAVAERV